MWRLQHEVAGGGGASGGGGETERAKAISAPAAAAGAEPWSVRRLAGASTDAAASLVAAFADHAAPVWRVDWNIFGTVLASTGNDGVLRLRRQVSGGSGEWETAADVPL